MLIRKTLPEDVDTILNIFDTARQFMHATGNPTQWNANYPALEDLEPDIQNGNSYVCVENDKVVATFTLIIGDEPNYQLIENGSWRSEAPYGTVHRLAKIKASPCNPFGCSVSDGTPRIAYEFIRISE